MYSVNYFSTEDKKWIECNNNLTEEEVKNALTWYRKNDPDTDYRVREITGVDFLDW